MNTMLVSDVHNQLQAAQPPQHVAPVVPAPGELPRQCCATQAYMNNYSCLCLCCGDGCPQATATLRRHVDRRRLLVNCQELCPKICWLCEGTHMG